LIGHAQRRDDCCTGDLREARRYSRRVDIFLPGHRAAGENDDGIRGKPDVPAADQHLEIMEIAGTQLA
jgi:hypothetical protein